MMQQIFPGDRLYTLADTDRYIPDPEYLYPGPFYSINEVSLDEVYTAQTPASDWDLVIIAEFPMSTDAWSQWPDLYGYVYSLDCPVIGMQMEDSGWGLSETEMYKLLPNVRLVFIREYGRILRGTGQPMAYPPLSFPLPFPYPFGTEEIFNFHPSTADRPIDVVHNARLRSTNPNKTKATRRVDELQGLNTSTGFIYHPDYLRNLQEAKIAVFAHGFTPNSYQLAFGDSHRLLSSMANGAMILWYRDDVIRPHPFKNGEHFVGYHDSFDITRLVKYYLTHNDERIAIATAGQEHLRAYHTTQARGSYFLNILETFL